MTDILAVEMYLNDIEEGGSSHLIFFSFTWAKNRSMFKYGLLLWILLFFFLRIRNVASDA